MQTAGGPFRYPGPSLFCVSGQAPSGPPCCNTLGHRAALGRLASPVSFGGFPSRPFPPCRRSFRRSSCTRMFGLFSCSPWLLTYPQRSRTRHRTRRFRRPYSDRTPRSLRRPSRGRPSPAGRRHRQPGSPRPHTSLSAPLSLGQLPWTSFADLAPSRQTTA